MKVVFDHAGPGDVLQPQRDSAALATGTTPCCTSNPPTFYQHVGLYAYRRDFLLKLAAMPPSPLEQIEKLEQLRVLEAGYSILVGVVDEPTFGIDTPDDYRAFVEKPRQTRMLYREASELRPWTCHERKVVDYLLSLPTLGAAQGRSCSRALDSLRRAGTVLLML